LIRIAFSQAFTRAVCRWTSVHSTCASCRRSIFALIRDGLASFDEEPVFDVFDQVCGLVEPGIENSRKRATHTIQRLRGQRMLARVDATGIVSAGEYALASLATVIVKSFLDDELTN
jgi:hypothetical protein